MFNSTTIGGGLGTTPGRLLAWGLGARAGLVATVQYFYGKVKPLRDYIKTRVAFKEREPVYVEFKRYVLISSNIRQRLSTVTTTRESVKAVTELKEKN